MSKIRGERMARRLFLFIAVLLVVTLNTGRSFSEKSSDVLENEVYNTVAQKMYVRPKNKFIVFKNQTGQLTKTELLNINNNLRKYMPALQKDTVFNFVVRNEKQFPLKKIFRLSVPYDTLDAKKLITHEDWVAFNKKFPKARGVITLSRAGFNVKRTQALVVIAFQIYAGLGEEIAVMLRRHKGGWVIQQKYTMFKN